MITRAATAITHLARRASSFRRIRYAGEREHVRSIRRDLVLIPGPRRHDVVNARLRENVRCALRKEDARTEHVPVLDFDWDLKNLRDAIDRIDRRLDLERSVGD